MCAECYVDPSTTYSQSIVSTERKNDRMIDKMLILILDSFIYQPFIYQPLAHCANDVACYCSLQSQINENNDVCKTLVTRVPRTANSWVIRAYYRKTFDSPNCTRKCYHIALQHLCVISYQPLALRYWLNINTREETFPFIFFLLDTKELRKFEVRIPSLTLRGKQCDKHWSSAIKTDKDSDLGAITRDRIDLNPLPTDFYIAT